MIYPEGRENRLDTGFTEQRGAEGVSFSACQLEKKE